EQCPDDATSGESTDLHATRDTRIRQGQSPYDV
ncbi:MAG: hypothetical protein JWR64_211, partial [Marmoricola sp.]|nr:hypothetical protein [Marmoricola sp.]